ncbi:MAG: glycosyltransferase family 2 protein [Rhabdochlamydiaceae bacterium]|jgi:glycosyltransferase involved in cell wall biosynthesis
MGKNFIRLFLVWTAALLPVLLIVVGIYENKPRTRRGPIPEKPFVIVVPSYNNEKYCEQNLLSILGQEYQNFRVIYLNDASKDSTAEKVDALVNKSPMKDRIRVIHREANVGSAQNLYDAIRSCENHEIIVRVDGDDFLAHPFVLKKLNKVYSDERVWMTYGNYLDYPNYNQNPKLCERIPAHVIRSNSIRSYKFVSTHLQTFYAGLGKKVAKEHLMKDGKFLPMAADIALLFPLLEMAGEHVQKIDEVLYLYNRINPISDHKKNLKLQSACEHHVRSLPKYDPLEKLPL